MVTPAHDWIAHHADVRPHKRALVDDRRGLTLTYADLDDRVGRLAGWLQGHDVGVGDRVAFLSQNTTDAFEALFACARLGAILVPLNWRLTTPELEFITSDCRPTVLIAEDEFDASSLSADHHLRLGPDYDHVVASAELLGEPARPSLEDAWAIMYTSGTTGLPKGAIVTHGMVLFNAINIGDQVRLTRDSVNLQVLPTFHTGGLNLYVTPCLRLGATAVVLREFHPDRLFEWFGSGEITHFFGVPAVYQFLAEDDRWESADLGQVASWACGGSAMPVALLERTETSPALFLVDEEHALTKAGSVGKPVLHTAIRVVNEQGVDVAPGTIGELWVSGPNVTPGYWERPEANEASFTDGWLRTGDAVRVDDDGYVYIVDRWKDMFISGGENVYPAEVEQVLFRHRFVADVAVIGVPDDKWGEVGVAVVVPRDGFDPDDMIAACDGALARYKIPKRVETIDELPRNAAGKVLKRELVEQFGS